MYKLTAADFADTGQWRLLLNISEDGLEAFLENTIHPEIEPQEMCRVTWNPDREKLYKNIEEAVYNNPRLLDDFATRIILYDRRTLLVPKDIAEESAGAEEELYQKVYEAEGEDIMTDFHKGVSAVWSPGPGVKSFLYRTFPGARITCNLLEKWREQSGRNEAEEKPGALRLYKEVRDKEVDFILMKDGALLSASTHQCETPKEIERLESLIRKAYEN